MIFLQASLPPAVSVKQEKLFLLQKQYCSKTWDGEHKLQWNMSGWIYQSVCVPFCFCNIDSAKTFNLFAAERMPKLDSLKSIIFPLCGRQTGLTQHLWSFLWFRHTNLLIALNVAYVNTTFTNAKFFLFNLFYCCWQVHYTIAQ